MRILFSLLLLVTSASAATWNASATRASINSALSSAAAGDTINIAAGTVADGTVMDITKGIYIIGAGTNSTTIAGRAFSIALSGADARVELSHFKITGPATESAGAISFPDDGTIHEDQFVAHDLHISGHWTAFDVDYEGAHGVVYNCTLTGNEHHGYFGGYPGAIQNHTAPPWAWNEAHYFTYEDCVIGPSSPEQIMFVTEFPFPYMIRYSAITERSGFPQIGDMHGDGGANDQVGVVINNNTFDLDNDGFAIEIRGGGYCLVYDNTEIGAGDPSIELDANCVSQCDDTHDTYIWDNTGFTISSDGNTLNVDYFIVEPTSFVGLAYPHPLRSGAVTVPNLQIVGKASLTGKVTLQ